MRDVKIVRNTKGTEKEVEKFKRFFQPLFLKLKVAKSGLFPIPE